ncbi:MAG: hypothetical protein ABIH37_05085 [archaeon]
MERGFSSLKNDYDLESSVGEQVILEDNNVIGTNMENKIKVLILGICKLFYL